VNFYTMPLPVLALILAALIWALCVRERK